MSNSPLITVSVVSHRQGPLLQRLLNDLQQYCADFVRVVLTLNVEEKLPFDCKDYDFQLHVRVNDKPKGFGANHNAAFALTMSPYFCVMNPDITLVCNPFESLLECCTREMIGVVAPLVVSPNGIVEKSARRFPTPLSILAKFFGHDSPVDYVIGKDCIFPDWIAGMFMLFPSGVYEEIGGFDEGYFLYYEDVDICARLWHARYKVTFCPKVSIIHNARHESHHNLRYMKWHISSMTRFFFKRALHHVGSCVQ